MTSETDKGLKEMIRKISITNFKSLKDLTLGCCKLNLLTGLNGSGKMAGVGYTVREWMEILGIPKGAFKGEMRFLTMHYGSLWCSKMRGMLRVRSKVATNKELLARVAKRN